MPPRPPGDEAGLSLLLAFVDHFRRYADSEDLAATASLLERGAAGLVVVLVNRRSHAITSLLTHADGMRSVDMPWVTWEEEPRQGRRAAQARDGFRRNLTKPAPYASWRRTRRAPMKDTTAAASAGDRASLPCVVPAPTAAHGEWPLVAATCEAGRHVQDRNSPKSLPNS